jgi:hypothetical protein
MRALAANMVKGVTKGFERKLSWLAWVTAPRLQAPS